MSPVDFFADGKHTPVETIPAFRRIFVQTRLVFVKLIIFPVFRIGDVGHHHVRARKDALFPAPVVQRLQGRSRGDVHVMQIKARNGDHPEPESAVQYARRQELYDHLKGVYDMETNEAEQARKKQEAENALREQVKQELASASASANPS